MIQIIVKSENVLCPLTFCGSVHRVYNWRTGALEWILPPWTVVRLAYTVSWLYVSLCWEGFYLASSYASAVLAVVNSVRPSESVWESVTRVLYDKTKQCIADILIPHERAINLAFDTNSGWWVTSPLPSALCAQSDPPLRNTPTSTDFRV